ncbi:MAG TPA: nicotinate (nicotinamide) nucleotide adenylyltransferase [Bdellovibrionota bacterium]
MSPDFRISTILFGGSFDPIHEGHLHVAKSALAAVPEAKQVVFVPASVSPGKANPAATAAQRLKWLELAVRGPGFSVWDTEVRRGGQSYTIETLKEALAFGAANDRLFWLLGADAYRGISGWKDPDGIRKLCRLLVVNREGTETRAQHPSDQIISISLHPASSTKLREQLAAGDCSSPWIPPPVRPDLEKLLPAQNPYARN